MITYGDITPDFGIEWPGFEKRDYLGKDADKVRSDYETKTRIEKAALDDPVGFGWVLPSWKELQREYAKYHTHVVLGGNRASKSTCIARLCIHLLETIPECRIRAFHVSNSKSITEQQAAVWEALPKRYKDLSGKRDGRFSTTFTQRNGFIGDKLILPPKSGYARGSELIFGNYSQYRNDPQTIEGWWAHLVWCDEEVPQKMFERLLTRILDVRGRMVLSFTTIQGWTALVADILGRTKTIQKRRGVLLDRDLPVAQESLTRPGTRIYYFWTEDNPFIPPETIERMRGRPEAEILAVAYGIPTRSSSTPFPGFSESEHIIADSELPWNKPEADPKFRPKDGFTLYHVIDPAGGKPWSMIWAAVDRDGSIYIYRDWPDVGYGDWGEASEKPEGRAGQAQKANDFGIDTYVETISQLEEGEEIFERIIDPRLGNATKPSLQGATTIVSELEELGLVVHAAPGTKIEDGINLINDRLRRGPDGPRLRISSNCEQMIACMKNYTGCSRKEVWKDFIDCLRYLLESGADYIEKRALLDTGTTFSYG